MHYYAFSGRIVMCCLNVHHLWFAQHGRVKLSRVFNVKVAPPLHIKVSSISTFDLVLTKRDKSTMRLAHDDIGCLMWYNNHFDG